MLLSNQDCTKKYINKIVTEDNLCEKTRNFNEHNSGILEEKGSLIIVIFPTSNNYTDTNMGKDWIDP